MAPDGTEGLVYSGGEDAYPFNAIARPAPRGRLAKTKRSTGWLLMQHLAAAATGAGAAVSTDTRVNRLVCDDGRVVGVQAQRFGQTVTLQGPVAASCSPRAVSSSTTTCCASTAPRWCGAP